MPRTSSIILVALLGTGLAGCGEDAAENPEPGTEVEENRAQKALQLFATARAKSRTDKIPYLEKLVSLYPESPRVPEAHALIIQVLLHSTVGRADDALEKTRVFAHRHPTHALVVEAWYWMALNWKDDTERGPPVIAEWKAWLDKTRERDDLDDADFKAFLWLHSAYAANWVGDRQAALKLLGEATQWDVPDKNIAALIAFRTGSYRAAHGEQQEARTAFQKALQLVKDGARGVSAAAIRDELKSLRSDG